MAFAVFGDGRSFEATTLFRNNNNESPTCHRNAFVGATDKASSLQQPSALSANIMMPVDSHRLPLSTMVKNGETLLTTAAGAAGEKTHTRSRAIAIKRANSNGRTSDDGEQPVSASAERMYDWATWRMYERITDHRRRHPIKNPYTHRPSAATGAAVYEDEEEADDRDQSSNDFRTSGGSRRPLTPVNGVDQEHFFDGEVFELEI